VTEKASPDLCRQLENFLIRNNPNIWMKDEGVGCMIFQSVLDEATAAWGIKVERVEM
jgi:hypothetical protein